MQTIGERLEEARKRKGISVREAAESTKIRSDYLQKFEANTFDIDLPPLYIRGFIRTYAKFLDLDAERLVGDVDAALVRDGKPARREQREALGRVEFGGENRSSDTGEATGPAGRRVLDQAALIKYGVIGGGAIVVIVAVVLLISALTSRPSAKSGSGAQPPATALPESAQTLVLTAVEPTRVKVVQTVDNVVLFQGSLARGESKSIPKQGLLTITVEDRTKIRMEVNGRMLTIPTFASGNYGQFRLD
jgi:cytoskeleton protein RodZ